MPNTMPAPATTDGRHADLTNATGTGTAPKTGAAPMNGQAGNPHHVHAQQSPHFADTKAPWPPWLRELILIVVACLTSFISVKYEGVRTREILEEARTEQRELKTEIASIRRELPNREATELRFQSIDAKLAALQGQVKDNKDELAVQAMMLQRTRETLLKRGQLE